MRVFFFSLCCVALFGASIDDRVTQLEQQLSTIYVENPIGTSGVTTAEASPQLVDDCYHWFFTIDALFFRMAMGGTEFAASSNQLGFRAEMPTFPLKGSEKAMSFQWDWGLRVGLGYQFEYDGWDVCAEFTYFDTNNSASLSAGRRGAIIPQKGYSRILFVTPGFDFDFSHATSAKSSLDFDFLRLDVELGRDFYVSRRLSIRPHFGPTAALFDIEQKVTYSGGEIPDGGLGVNSVHIRDEMELDCVGPRVGFDTDWSIGKEFSVFANAAIGILYGYYDIEHFEKFSANHDNRLKITTSMHRFLPMGEVQAGLAWARYWADCNYHTVVSVGFEAQHWWRVNQLFNINDASTLKWQHYSEDLMLYGIDLRFRIDF
ncbi:MAG: hypothetical protein ChlgKO_05930 [Chlamydiales bacterium]